jgi:hypothetical protein
VRRPKNSVESQLFTQGLVALVSRKPGGRERLLRRATEEARRRLEAGEVVDPETRTALAATKTLDSL